ncbi:Potassium-transporting ATPase A subunit [Loktanella fryxellensis]|uniref:Potassium-transporting ATPase A subunit n=1 Tax=Loktanella fryxellensis TaxID=245187 RepID=A0A1H8JA63_9RHOB|nr:Potassium-transporting ATPase A subunit [Loktanella fryxellensis]
MLLGRFVPIIPPVAIVGSPMGKRRAAESAGTLGVEDATFGIMLAITVVIFGALTFLPAAALGPITEHTLLPRKALTGELQ